jgi:thiamine biosynthesis protein ThiS
MTIPLTITVNGQARTFDDRLTVRDLTAREAPMSRAVAVNGHVVPASAHGDTWLTHGDVVELVTAVAGG